MAAIIGFKEQQLVLRNRMLPSKEDGVILVLHQGQRNSAFFRQDFIKHLGDSERQILVLLNDQRRDFEQHLAN